MNVGLSSITHPPLDARARCATLAGEVASLQRELDAHMPVASGAEIDASWRMLSEAVKAFRSRAISAPTRPLRSMVSTLASFDRLGRIVRQACDVADLVRRPATAARAYDWAELIVSSRGAISPAERRARTGWRRGDTHTMHGDPQGVSSLVTCAVQHLLDTADDAEVIVRFDRENGLHRVWVSAAMPAWWARGSGSDAPVQPARAEWADAWGALVLQLASLVGAEASLDQTDRGSRWCLTIPDRPLSAR